MQRNIPVLLLCVILVTTSGCAGSEPADPDRAAAALRTALDAWVQGKTTEALKELDPPVRVVDPDWDGGRGLAKYELLGDGRPSGGSLRYVVRLWIQEGPAIVRETAYSVTTRPAVVIVREDD